MLGDGRDTRGLQRAQRPGRHRGDLATVDALRHRLAANKTVFDFLGTESVILPDAYVRSLISDPKIDLVAEIREAVGEWVELKEAMEIEYEEQHE